MRWPFVLAGLLFCAVGFGVNISNATIGVKYFGTFLCVAGSYSALPGIVAWYALKATPLLMPLRNSAIRFSGNVAGQYKRAVALALHIGIGNISAIIASNIYKAQDSPRYGLGRKLKPPSLVLTFDDLHRWNRVGARRHGTCRVADYSAHV
jgi:hypothetical protein